MKRRDGFTLIELMIVVAIIGAISVVLTPMGVSSLHDARATKILGDLRNIQIACVDYSILEGELPSIEDGFPDFHGILDRDELDFGPDMIYFFDVSSDYLQVEVSGISPNTEESLERMVWSSSFATWEASSNLYKIFPFGKGNKEEPEESE